MVASHKSILALDVGEKRVGVAAASLVARLPQALITLKRGDTFFSDLTDIIQSKDISAIVVGLPRNLDGKHTQQTRITEEFVEQLEQHFTGSIHLQDEALTSVRAEDELRSRSKSYERGDVDALAATYILEDFLREHQELQP